MNTMKVLSYIFAINFLLVVIEATPVTTTVCADAVDIVMVVDASGSVEEPHFQTLKGSLEDFGDKLKISDQGVRIGIVLFSTSVHEPITQLTGNADFLRSQFRDLPYLEGGTNTDAGIDRAALELRNTGRSAPRIMVVLTDGEANDINSTKQAANNAKDEGITIYAVGIGPNVAQSGLEDIASGPTRIITAASFDVLVESLKTLTQSICGHMCSVGAGPHGFDFVCRLFNLIQSFVA